ncbi:MAG: hypothetical protein M1813_002154 [Trichoglossum hirsutum]|nr:MAG: hypothetical protein M1813_002154 [Trichoglossum hirsutum]
MNSSSPVKSEKSIPRNPKRQKMVKIRVKATLPFIGGHSGLPEYLLTPNVFESPSMAQRTQVVNLKQSGKLLPTLPYPHQNRLSLRIGTRSASKYPEAERCAVGSYKSIVSVAAIRWV